MKSIVKKIGKLRGRGFDELCTRGVQAASAAAERRGWSRASRLPTDAELTRLLDVPREFSPTREMLAKFCRDRAHTAAFAGLVGLESTAKTLRTRFDLTNDDSCVARAHRIVAKRFDLLGLKDVFFGDPVDWHAEPLSRKRANPASHWSVVDYLNPEVAGDKKITWELNRHGYFVTLGRAYHRTGDEIFARTFVEHLAAWMEANPPKRGINWASSLEVAFRSIAWLWSLHLFRDSVHLTPHVFARALKFIYTSARHLETYLSTYFSPNTHLTGEALALYYIGTLLPQFKRAERWREVGKATFLAAIERHVRADGVYFEQSSYYHRYTTDFCLHLRLLADLNGDSPSDGFDARLMKLLDHLMYITRPDGTTPFFGDDDGGRLVALDDQPPHDFRATLATAAAVFGRADYKYVATLGADSLTVAEELLWLLGQDGLRRYDELEAAPPACASRDFPAGGYYVMRDGWETTNNYMLIDAGRHGADTGGHAHADALAFECAARGRSVFVDSGTFTYTGSLAERDRFRSTQGHNTLTIDDESSSLPGATAFRWDTQAKCAAQKWQSHERFDYLRATHDGYMRLATPAIHGREVLFLKNDYWIVRDTVTPVVEADALAQVAMHDGDEARERKYDLRFHCAPTTRTHGAFEDATPEDATPEDATPEDATTANAARVVCHATETDALLVQTFGAAAGHWQHDEAWISPTYAARVPASVLTYTAIAPAHEKQIFTTFLVPCRLKEKVAVSLDAETPRLFRVRQARWCDLVLSGESACASPPSSGEASSGDPLSQVVLRGDFAWSWVRMDEAEKEIHEFLLLDGREAWCGDERLCLSRERCGYVVARRAGDKLIIETDAAGEIEVASCGASEIVVNGVAHGDHET